MGGQPWTASLVQVAGPGTGCDAYKAASCCITRILQDTPPASTQDYQEHSLHEQTTHMRDTHPLHYMVTTPYNNPTPHIHTLVERKNLLLAPPLFAPRWSSMGQIVLLVDGAHMLWTACGFWKWVGGCC